VAICAIKLLFVVRIEVRDFGARCKISPRPVATQGKRRCVRSVSIATNKTGSPVQSRSRIETHRAPRDLKSKACLDCHPGASNYPSSFSAPRCVTLAANTKMFASRLSRRLSPCQLRKLDRSDRRFHQGSDSRTRLCRRVVSRRDVCGRDIWPHHGPGVRRAQSHATWKLPQSSRFGPGSQSADRVYFADRIPGAPATSFA